MRCHVNETGEFSTSTSVRVLEQVKAEFHYAIHVSDLVADLISDLAFDKFMRICDQLATFLGQKQVADRFELSRHVEILEPSVTGRKSGLRLGLRRG